MPEEPKRATFVREIMNPQVVVAKPEATAREAAKVMTEGGIGSLIIMKDDKIDGIVTESDMVKKIIADGGDAEQITLDQIMTAKVITVSDDATIEEASELMVENNIKKLPVIRANKLVGIVTATDLISFEPKFIEALGQLLMLRPKTSVAG